MIYKNTTYKVYGLTDSYVINTGNQLNAIHDGDEILLAFEVSPIGACTLAVDVVSAKSIKVYDARGFFRDPFSSEMLSNKRYSFVYYAKENIFVLMNPERKLVPNNLYQYVDDFDAGTAETTGTVGRWVWAWVTAGTGTMTADYEAHTAVNNAFGVVRVTRGAGTGSLWFYPPHWTTVDASATKGMVLGNTNGLDVSMRIALPTAATTGKVMRFGMYEDVSQSGADDGLFFRCTDLGNWEAVTRGGSQETAVDTGVPQSTSFQTFSIIVNNNAAYFYIDNVLVATITTTLPTVALSPVIYVAHDTNAQSFDIDYFSVNIHAVR